MRKPLMVMVAAVMAIIGFAAPAQATVTAVDMPFGMAYGNSTTSGTVHFTDGYSATVSGVVHAASGERQICAYGVNGTLQSEFRCSNFAAAGGPNQSFSLPLSIPAPGGVQRVDITMWDRPGTLLAREFCTRNGCTRVF
jgi:hypothetical protein